MARIDAFVPIINSILLVSDLIIATILYAQARVFRSRSLTVLATAFVFTALLVIPHTLTFPGAFHPDGLLGAGLNTTSWLAHFRRLGIAVGIIAYVVLKQADARARPGSERRSPNIAVAALTAIALATGATMLTTIGHDLLPQIYLNHFEVIYRHAFATELVIFSFFLAAMALLYSKRSSVLDLWLLVAVSSWLAESLLIMTLAARFTVGYYYLYAVILFAHLLILFALITESQRLYARLARSTAARIREREARLASLEAMARAISYEVGQPLSAVTNNATAGLNWLTNTPPDPEKAVEALRATLEAGQRTFDVVKSTRAMFAREPATTSEFCLNELVRETASLLDTELAANQVALRLQLDEALPPIRGNRSQLRQVLVNLFTNAIESLNEPSCRLREIEIRTMSLPDRDVLLEISDTGPGIQPDATARIFEIFFTTKDTGTGLGLSLSRNIVEDHGGRIWASPSEEHGARFYLQLPRSYLH
ncbi:sensor histidine kinase [Sphingomonas sp.]|uniref:sensor histidine kinase n=1 Tax=Sphingomonas sp. TaxID=28214 RepID=UPI002FC8688E